MKTHKNILWSLGSYLLSIILICFGFVSAPHLGTTPDYLFYIIWVGFILIPVGIFLGLRSDMKHESPWGGTLLMMIGVLYLIPVDLYWGLADMGQSSAVALVVLLVVLLFLVIRLILRVSKKKRPA